MLNFILPMSFFNHFTGSGRSFTYDGFIIGMIIIMYNMRICDILKSERYDKYVKACSFTLKNL